MMIKQGSIHFPLQQRPNFIKEFDLFSPHSVGFRDG